MWVVRYLPIRCGARYFASLTRRNIEGRNGRLLGYVALSAYLGTRRRDSKEVTPLTGRVWLN